MGDKIQFIITQYYYQIEQAPNVVTFRIIIVKIK